MNSEINKLIKEDFNDVLDFKEKMDFKKFSKYSLNLKYTSELRELLYSKTEECLEVYNKCVFDLVDKYINSKIDFKELEQCLEWEFTSKNNQKKEYFNEIFPEFIKLLINNKDILDKDKIIIVKPRPKPEVDNFDDNIDFNESIENENIKMLNTDKILSKYKNLRKNQIIGITNTIKQNFTTGCHNQIMGSGKTVLELLHIDVHNNYFLQETLKNSSNYLFVSSRINILKNIFFDEKSEFWKYGIDLENYNIVDLVYGNLNLNNYSSSKPNIIVVNIQYLKNIFENTNYYNKLVDKLKLVIFDECHNISAPTVFEFMNNIKEKNIPIIGFSATPMRTTKTAKENFKEIFSIDDKVNLISTYDLFEGIIDEYILPFKIKQFEFKGVYNENSDDNSSEKVKYSKHDFEKNKLIVKKIIQDEIKELPYCKFVAWCSSIGNLIKWKEFFEEEIPELAVYVAHSGNATYPAEDEYDAFYNLKPKNKNDKINAILLNVNIISEGCDIDFVDCGIFLDPVKNKNIVTYLQNAGRICRTDIYNKKTSANIIYTYISDKKDIPSQIISYFEMLLQLTEKNNDYYNKMNDLLANLKVDNKEIRIVIDKKKNHDCVMYLDREIKDFAKIKKEIGKIIKEKYSNEENDKEMDKLKEIDYTFSKILRIKFFNIEMINNFNPALIQLYKLINNFDNIMKYTSIGLVKGKKEGRTCTYLENLDITYTDVNAKTAIIEIYKQCKYNKVDLDIYIELKTKEKIHISIINGICRIDTI